MSTPDAEAKAWTKRLAREDVGALPFRVQIESKKGD